MPLLISFIGRNMKVSELVYEKISPLFNGEIKLVDVEYVKKNDGMHLIIYIDKPEGISLDDCEMVNDAVEPVIDEADPIEGSYYLEISSPGLERDLTRDEHFGV